MLRLNQYFLPFLENVPAEAYEGSYDHRLVFLSLAIASLSAFVALSVSGRIVAASTTRGRLVWASAGAVSMGGGIWAMHFIGMLAFALPCGVGYDPIETVLSMVPGMLASGAALSVISRTTAPSVGRLLGGALLMGGGIGTMHYSGMAAMRPEALLIYDTGMVAISVIVAIVLAFISLSIRFRLRAVLSSSPLPAMLLSATIMGLAVSGMHYTAMYAATFYHHPMAVLSGLHLPPTFLAMLIAVFAVLIASATLAASYAGRQIDLVAQLSSEMSQRAELERDAQRSRARTQAIVDAVADAIVTIDRGGRIRQWSRGAERIFGYTADEVVGEDLTVLMPTPHRERHERYVDSFLKTRDAKIIGIGRELTAIRKDGSEFPIDLTVSEVQGIDEALFTGILRDITERKRAEQELIDARQQAEAASRAKSEFLATMSHEIRTPMNGVLGMANLLASTTLSERQGRLTDNLLRSGQALMAIINDILDFSKIEAGRLELLEADFEPREVIAEVAELFSERCASKGLEFVYFVDEAVPASLRGDPVRLRQICMNLLGNAIKFTERGEILVKMAVGETHDDHVLLNIAVIDTGIGIPEEKQAAVFESFHQIDSTMTRARGGSGLGLAIVKQLVELMGGQIGVESEIGRGSRFWFTVRLQKSAGEIASPRGARHLPRKLSALVIDANAISAHNISQYLMRWGLEAAVHTTIEGAAAAHGELAAAGRAFDVAIIDIKSLGDDGVSFASMLRGNTAPKPTEIIFLAALDSFMGDDGKDRDAFATLAKPVRPSELFDCLTSIAAGARRRNASPLSTRQTAQAKRPRFDARILVAEDNSINQDVVVGMLDNIGCRTVTVPNGAAAVQAFNQETFNLILMDCEMPEMDGFEAAKRIRQTENLLNGLPENRAAPKRIPIIAVTAHALPEMRDKCALAGMDDFLTKPFDDLQLTEALRRHLEARMSPAPFAGGALAAATDEASKPNIPIDVAVIQQIRIIEDRGSKGLLRRVITKFIASAPAAAADIRAKHEARDGDALWRAAHALKSSASAVGAAQVASRCGEIEIAAREKGPEAASGMLSQLDADIGAAVRSLQALIDDGHATVH
jgi:two-component system, sensor histidine kinase and response regulator